MELFGKTREKLLEPVKNIAGVAVIALVIAVVALIVAVRK